MEERLGAADGDDTAGAREEEPSVVGADAMERARRAALGEISLMIGEETDGMRWTVLDLPDAAFTIEDVRDAAPNVEVDEVGVDDLVLGDGLPLHRIEARDGADAIAADEHREP